MARFIFGGALFVLGHEAWRGRSRRFPRVSRRCSWGASRSGWRCSTAPSSRGRLRPSAYVGFALGFVGLAFLFDPFRHGPVDRLGALVIVFGALAWSAGSLYSRGAPLPKRPLVSANLGAICGGILLTIVSIAGGELGEATWTWTRCSRSSISSSSSGQSASRPTAIQLLRAAPTSLVATYAYMNPIITQSSSRWAILGEEITSDARYAAPRSSSRSRSSSRASGAASSRAGAAGAKRVPAPTALPESGR